MFISPAYAQSGIDIGGISQLIPFVLIFVVFYFLLIRPQQKRAKEHRNLVNSLKKGNYIVTAGGITGKVIKAVEGSETVEVEITSGVVVHVIRQMIAEVRDKDGMVMKNMPKEAVKKAKAKK